MRRVGLSACLFAALLCATPALAQSKPAAKPAEPAKRSLPFPLGRAFIAVSYKDQAFKDDRPTLLISPQLRGSGFSACNNWSATVIPRADQRMAVGPVALTRRKCDDRLMHNEQVYIFVMQTAQAWYYDGRLLTLDGPYGKIVFEPAA